jgi:hypothetical protein
MSPPELQLESLAHQRVVAQLELLVKAGRQLVDLGQDLGLLLRRGDQVVRA